MGSNKDDKISIFLGLLIIVSAAGILSHVIVIPAILDEAGRDAWISVLLIGFLFLGWIFAVYYIQRKTQQEHLFMWIKEKGSGFLAYFLGILAAFFVFAASTVSFIDTVSWATITYLPKTPGLVLSFSLAIICLLPALNGIRSIAVINGILLPAVILFGFLVAAGNIPHKDYSLIRPFLENGWWPVLRGMPASGAGIFELFFVLLFQHKIEDRFKLKSLLITGLALIMLTLGPLLGSIAIFGPEEAANQRFPAYEEWAMLSLGRYVEHLDFISIYQWMVGIFARISLSIYLIPEIFNFKGKKRVIIQIFLALFLTSSVYFNPMSDMTFIAFLKNYFLPLSTLFIFSFTLLLCLYVLVKSNKGGKHGEA